MNFIIRIALISFSLIAPASAQKLVDPTTVAPEYREAAEKRRAEQIRQRECALKADFDKVGRETAPPISIIASKRMPANN